MKKLMLWIIALAALPGSAFAQNITGTWQGAIQPPQAQGRELRIVIKISTTDADKLAAVMYSIDQQSPAIPATTFTRNGSTVKMTVTPLNGTYEGKVSSDGNSIAGTWSQGMPLTLNLVRATPRDRLDHSGTPASAQAYGRGCETSLRSRHDQAERSCEAGQVVYRERPGGDHHQHHSERPHHHGL